MKCKIKPIENNIEKKVTYAFLNKKNKIALENKEYETVIHLSYSMIEDRLLSFLHYLFVVNREDEKLYPSDYIDKIIRPMLKFKVNVPKQRIYKMNNISTKIKVLKIFLKKDDDGTLFINDCYNIIENNIGVKNFKKLLSELNSWIKIRNEIVHASFNKKIIDLDVNVELAAKEGCRLAKLMSSYTNKIKTNKNQICVRDKWSFLNQLVDTDYLFNICVQYDVFNTEFSSFKKEINQIYENIKTIREKSNIADIISKYISIEKKGENYLAFCPFHNDSNLGLFISPEKHIYKCFCCGKSGDVIDFIMNYENTTFSEVYKKLCDRLELEYNLSKQFIKEEKKFEILKENIDNTSNPNYIDIILEQIL